MKKRPITKICNCGASKWASADGILVSLMGVGAMVSSGAREHFCVYLFV
jgi:hypothetical protein